MFRSKTFWRLMFLSLVPGVMLFFGKFDTIDGLLPKKIIGIPIETCKILSYVSGLVIQLVYWPFANSKLQEDLKQRNDTLKASLPDNVNAYLRVLKKYLNTDKSLNIRFFMPVKSFRNYLPNRLGGRVILRHKKIEALCNQELPTDLQFIASPEQFSQGMVGEAFITKDIAVTTNQDKKENTEYYRRLSEYQKQNTGKFRFVLTVPIFNNRNKIIGVIAFDSIKRYNVPEIDSEKKKILESIAKDMFNDFHSFIEKD